MAAGEIRGGWGRIEPWTVLATGQVAAFGQTGLLFGFPGGSVVKNLPAMQETQVLSLGWEDLLEEGMATHPLPRPVFLPGESPGQRSLAGCSPWGCKESDMTKEIKQQGLY